SQYVYSGIFVDCQIYLREYRFNSKYSDCLLNYSAFTPVSQQDINQNLHLLQAPDCLALKNLTICDREQTYISDSKCKSQSQFKIQYNPVNRQKIQKIHIQIQFYFDSNPQKDVMRININGIPYSSPISNPACAKYTLVFDKTLEINSDHLDINFTPLKSKTNIQTYLNIFVLAVQLCQEFCKQCDENSACTSCIDGYYLSNGSCLKCPVGCKSCQSQNLCDQSEEKYFKDQAVCRPCHSSCQFCIGASDQDCTVCSNSTYFLSQRLNNLCVSQCDISQAQYVDTTDPNQKYCNICSDLCQTCNDQRSCTSCIETYYLQADGTCSPCDSSCQQCNGPSSSDCFACKEKFYLNGNTCSPCHPACQQCKGPSSNNCQKCTENYYLNGNTCSPCHKSCKSCTGPLVNNCIICSDPSQYISIKQNNICISMCDLTYAQYVDSSNEQQKYCRPCQAVCKICNNQNTCETCIDNYFLDQNKKCSPCDSTCQSCKGSLKTDCLICNSELFYQPSTKLCVQNCSSNEFVNSQNQCQQCGNQCASCDGPGLDQCKTCQEGSYFFKGRCVSFCPNGFQNNINTLN
ncbi:hypothetical protein ABPG73_007805, partial [Tetrahymena malaccensis]